MGKIPDSPNKLWEEYFEAELKDDDASMAKVLERLLELDPTNPEVHMKTGFRLQRNNDPDGAVVSFRRAAQNLIDAGFKHMTLPIQKQILKVRPKDPEALAALEEIMRELESESVFEDIVSAPAPKAAAATDSELEIPEIFSSLTREEFGKLMATAARRSFKNDDIVIKEGDPGESVFLIESGRAAVTNDVAGRTVVIAMLKAGDLFGEMAMLLKKPRSATLKAFGDLVAWEIEKDVLKDFINDHPQLMKGLIKYHDSRMKEFRDKITQEGGREVKGGSTTLFLKNKYKLSIKK